MDASATKAAGAVGVAPDAGALRRDLLELLAGGAAHIAPREALQGVPAELRTARVASAPHSIWELLEHMRLAQEDILRYTLEVGWTSPAWPDGYWPPRVEAVSDEEWDRSVERFLADLDAVADVVRDGARVLTDAIPHGEGRTYLREVLLVADHNAYHLGQIVQLRKQWGNPSGVSPDPFRLLGGSPA